jgi:hypothetical protein
MEFEREEKRQKAAMVYDVVRLFIIILGYLKITKINRLRRRIE